MTEVYDQLCSAGRIFLHTTPTTMTIPYKEVRKEELHKKLRPLHQQQIKRLSQFYDVSEEIFKFSLHASFIANLLLRSHSSV